VKEHIRERKRESQKAKHKKKAQPPKKRDNHGYKPADLGTGGVESWSLDFTGASKEIGENREQDRNSNARSPLL